MSKINELKHKISLLVNHPQSERYADIINKLQKQLATLEEHEALKADLKGFEVKEETPAGDAILDKLSQEFLYYADKIELLRGADKSYDNFFKKLDKINNDISNRLLLLEKLDSIDTSQLLDSRVVKYRARMEAISAELQKQALAEEQAKLKLSDAKKDALARAGLDMSLQFDDVAEGSEGESNE